MLFCSCKLVLILVLPPVHTPVVNDKMLKFNCEEEKTLNTQTQTKLGTQSHMTVAHLVELFERRKMCINPSSSSRRVQYD